MEKTDTRKRLGFCAMELSPNLIFIGALLMKASTLGGSFLRFASLLIVASLGVILKIARQERKVVNRAKNANATTAPTAIPGLTAYGMVGMD